MKRVFLLALISWLLLACMAIAPRRTPTPEEAAKTVLEKVADTVCPGAPQCCRFSAEETVYELWCTPAAGHFTVATLQWFSSESDAHAAFENRREGRTAVEFHGFPLVVWAEDHPSFLGGQPEYRTWLWQAQQWLVQVGAFDDTHFTIAPDPGSVSEAIYQAGREYGLFQAKEE
ncbi:MAG: hypothetical protein H5T61_13410 [Thermoflexales bacterium]|nr:hypothetical protein [Thermoflexales bacterium]